MTLARRTYSVVTPRPSTDVFFSTNFYHCTWHVLSDERGACLLARLLWGLSFQRRPGTLVLLHGRHLRPTPFGAAPSDPVLLVPADLTPVDDDAFRRLKALLPRLGRPDQTVRWHTFGLDQELRRREGMSPSAVWREERASDWPENRGLGQRERMRRVGGFLCYSAPAQVLRQQALRVHALRTSRGSHMEMDYHFLAEKTAQGGSFADGEVQIFLNYRQLVSAAGRARREVLARPNAPTDPQRLEEVICTRRDVLRRSQRAR